MNDAILPRLCCADCGHGRLVWQSFRNRAAGEIEDGVAWCAACKSWYPIEEELLELLPRNLAYREDRYRFWTRYRDRLQPLGLQPLSAAADHSTVEAQRKQQEHFDWYAGNDLQTYTAYEQMPFWQAVDALTFDGWRRQVRPGKWLLDVGCAQGRSTFHFMDLPLHVVGFDISKVLVRQAIRRYRQGRYAADATFFVGDGSRLPFLPESFDYVLIYGVLHHLPDPARTCREVARVLRPGGVYFGSENNQTIFRTIFDLLQRLNPLWHEEAGAQPLISAGELRQWFAATDVRLECHTHVFTPPHLVNLLGQRYGRSLLHVTDWLGRRLPFLRNNGGLITVRGQCTAQAPASRKAA